MDRHIGPAAARKSLAIMIIDEALGADRPQPGLPLDLSTQEPLDLSTQEPLVKRALLLMQQSMDSPPAVADLAQRLGVGRRKLERHFAEALGVTPREADRRIRLAQARHLLSRTDRSVARIAAETGFCDASHLIRAFREAEGTTPDAWRRAQRPEPSTATP